MASRQEQTSETRKAGKAGARTTPTSRQPPSERELIDRLLTRAGDAVEEAKITVSEVIRLLQLKRELGGEGLKEIEVRWVEPSETADAVN